MTNVQIERPHKQDVCQLPLCLSVMTSGRQLADSCSGSLEVFDCLTVSLMYITTCFNYVVWRLTVGQQSVQMRRKERQALY